MQTIPQDMLAEVASYLGPVSCWSLRATCRGIRRDLANYRLGLARDIFSEPLSFLNSYAEGACQTILWVQVAGYIRRADPRFCDIAPYLRLEWTPFHRGHFTAVVANILYRAGESLLECGTAYGNSELRAQIDSFSKDIVLARSMPEANLFYDTCSSPGLRMYWGALGSKEEFRKATVAAAMHLRLRVFRIMPEELRRTHAKALFTLARCQDTLDNYATALNPGSSQFTYAYCLGDEDTLGFYHSHQDKKRMAWFTARDVPRMLKRSNLPRALVSFTRLPTCEKQVCLNVLTCLISRGAPSAEIEAWLLWMAPRDVASPAIRLYRTGAIPRFARHFGTMIGLRAPSHTLASEICDGAVAEVVEDAYWDDDRADVRLAYRVAGAGYN